MKLPNIKTKYLVVTFAILGLLSVWFDFFSNKEVSSQHNQKSKSVDTYIPAGMTLVPIEIQNIESLKNILGDFGVVDLYIPSLDPKVPSQKIASNVKVMRAPLNPDVFAVLVRTKDAAAIAGRSDPYFVTVQNPKNQDSRIQNSVTQTQIITELQ